ncbi:hypothetical protein K2173_022402 [Erythroxylum novogranatense]|uniref:RNA methyltransferase n=1 Tax=Erythroxylum novogranatense TaxID=1862640 RepID=A0AAV8TJE2_9ROSI|nr:hypothetical protein K2173_022402 [Erythroxylum novogranatense]
MGKKKRSEEENGVEIDSEKKKKKKKKKERKATEIEEKKAKEEIPTISIAVPGSIIDNTQSLELATRLAGQIARAATIFRIDEVVVFDNKSSSVNEDSPDDENESGSAFLIRILRYLETPQYLRKALFPRHNSLRFVGLLPPLDAPHHLRKHEWAPFREGVTLGEKATISGGTMVDVGLILPHQIVSLSKPRDEAGMYWGYRVRYAASISLIFKGSPYKGGYDYLIGTSEHGLKIKSSEISLPKFKHLLIAFGGLAGLEESIEEDVSLKGKTAREVFDSYLNTCPNQGSRTIRTEEAIFISLQYFQEPINRALQKAQS